MASRSPVVYVGGRAQQIQAGDTIAVDTGLVFANGTTIVLGTGTGTKFGTADDQKLAFFGQTPVVQQASINSPTGGAIVDNEARAAIVSLINTLEALGLIVTG